METFSALLAICAENSPVTDEFPAQRPVTQSFDVFSDLRLNKRLSKQSWTWWFETLSRPLWRHCNVKSTISKHMSQTKFMSMSREITLGWMPQNTFDGKSTLVQLMAWCHQATSDFLIQCWNRSMLPYHITRPQWTTMLTRVSTLV